MIRKLRITLSNIFWLYVELVSSLFSKITDRWPEPDGEMVKQFIRHSRGAKLFIALYYTAAIPFLLLLTWKLLSTLW